MMSLLLLVQIWLSRRRSRRLSVLWATLEDSDGSSLLSPPLVWSLSGAWVVGGPFQVLHPPSAWRVIVVEVGSLFGSRVGAVYAPVSCSSFFPPVVSGLFAPKWAVVVYFDKWQDDRWAFSLRTRLVLAALEVVYPFGSSVLYGLLVKSVSTV
ncbi:hypothetical protein YC2023_076658 [Brassica napus]